MSLVFIVLIVIILLTIRLDRLLLASIFLKVYRIFNCKNIWYEWMFAVYI